MDDKNKDILNGEDEGLRTRTGKGFYAICAVCLLAIGIASWAAFSSINELETDKGSSTVSLSEKAPSSQTAGKESSTPKTPPADSSVTGSTDQAATAAPPAASFFLVPMQQGVVYKGFSDDSLQYSNTYGDYRAHIAVDIISEESDTVKSCGDGIVTEVEKDPLYGSTVVIDHGNGITARYCGLKENVNVKKGDTVSSTSLIGSLGGVPAECLDPAHLHLEFYRDGVPIDATLLFK